MNMTTEMVDDLMDEAFDDDEEAVDDVINQLDDELALEVNRALAEATGKKLEVKQEEDDDIDLKTQQARLDALMM